MEEMALLALLALLAHLVLCVPSILVRWVAGTESIKVWVHNWVSLSEPICTKSWPFNTYIILSRVCWINCPAFLHTTISFN